MAKGSLRTVGAGFGWLALVLAANAVQAQDTSTVGNPQLKDFQLPGTRTAPPANAQQQPAPTTNTVTPPPVTLPPSVPLPSTQTPAARPPASTAEPEADEAPAASRSRPARREPAPAPAPSAAIPTPAPVTAPVPAAPEQVLPVPPANAPTTKWQPPVPVAEPAPETPWLYIGLGALLALLALLGLVLFRRSRASRADRGGAEAVVSEASAEPDPLFAKRPAAAPEPAISWVTPSTPDEPASEAGADMRPHLELEFKAERAAATLTDASVQYELTIRNVGDAPAHNIRIQPNMFNAGREQEKEIGDFFALPVRAEEPPAFSSFAPQAEANLKGSIRLPREELREITIEGRRLFIPIVAFNVYYEWGDGRSGQTSMSYLVGREAPTPQDKMGAFRLDLGPRLYRSVGQRQASLAKVV